MTGIWQRAIFEAQADLPVDPLVAALLAGFAVIVGGVAFLTPAGRHYLATIAEDEVAA